MSEWLRTNLNTVRFWPTLRFYAMGLGVVGPIAAVIGMLFGVEKANLATPFLIVTLVAVEYGWEYLCAGVTLLKINVKDVVFSTSRWLFALRKYTTKRDSLENYRKEILIRSLALDEARLVFADKKRFGESEVTNKILTQTLQRVQVLFDELYIHKDVVVSFKLFDPTSESIKVVFRYYPYYPPHRVPQKRRKALVPGIPFAGTFSTIDFQENRAIVVPDVRLLRDIFTAEHYEQLSKFVGSFIAWPVRIKEKTVGVVKVDSTHHHVFVNDEPTRTAMQAIADHLSNSLRLCQFNMASLGDVLEEVDVLESTIRENVVETVELRLLSLPQKLVPQSFLIERK